MSTLDDDAFGYLGPSLDAPTLPEPKVTAPSITIPQVGELGAMKRPTATPSPTAMPRPEEPRDTVLLDWAEQLVGAAKDAAKPKSSGFERPVDKQAPDPRTLTGGGGGTIATYAPQGGEIVPFQSSESGEAGMPKWVVPAAGAVVAAAALYAGWSWWAQSKARTNSKQRHKVNKRRR